jgi:hypothetical protein
MISIGVGIGIVWFFLSSYDFTPITKENGYGIEVKLVYSESYLPFMCPVPCEGTHFSLEVTSEKNAFLRGYNICNGITCVKNDGSNVFLRSGAPAEDHSLIGVFGIESWKVGDTVDIRVKVTDAVPTADHYAPDESKLVFVDLGETKIIG